jgi:hypothetical protein
MSCFRHPLVFAVLVAVLVAACRRTSSQDSNDAPSTDSTATPNADDSATRSKARLSDSRADSATRSNSSPSDSRRSGEPPAPERDGLDTDAICARYAQVPLPAADQPSPAEKKSLTGCDAEAMYYGIGVAQDFAKARKCAYAQLEAGNAPMFGGEGILMMVYAGGKGVPANLDLATKFACLVGGAPFELELRVGHFEDARKAGEPSAELDLCDHITSGFMMGHCAGHAERVAELTRGARQRAATSSLPRAQLATLERCAKAFFDSREGEEVDRTGTGRAAFMVEERATLEDDFVAALEKLNDPKFAPTPRSPEVVEKELNEVYGRVLRCIQPSGQKELPEIPGSVTSEGVRKTERLWLPYRDAWVALALKTRPGAPRDLWNAWITEARIQMLRDLESSCPGK